MGDMAVVGASLLEAAIRAAILPRAPRRTVQAVSSAVAGVLTRPTATEATNASRCKKPARAQRSSCGEAAGDAERSSYEGAHVAPGKREELRSVSARKDDGVQARRPLPLPFRSTTRTTLNRTRHCCWRILFTTPYGQPATGDDGSGLQQALVQEESAAAVEAGLG